MDELKVYQVVEIIRTLKGMSKSQLARKCGYTPAWYTPISTGKHRLDVETLKQIADVLEVDVCIFFKKELSESLKSKKVC